LFIINRCFDYYDFSFWCRDKRVNIRSPKNGVVVALCFTRKMEAKFVIVFGLDVEENLNLVTTDPDWSEKSKWL
jgi:hypothetical protein